MIVSFADKETARIARGDRSRAFPPDIQQKAFLLLQQMLEIGDWNELRNPPGNKLHALHGDRKGQYAIRINRQWRIVFTPMLEGLSDVEITDYH